MSDIPDWLVELASQRDDDEEQEPDAGTPQTSPDDKELELDSQRSSPVVAAPADGAGLDKAGVVEALRSQVDMAEIAPEPEPIAQKGAIRLSIPGLLPWQQAVLAILVLLDVAVIGFLFLLMLGKMSIG